MALSSGLRNYETVEKVYLSCNRLTCKAAKKVIENIGEQVSLLDFSHNSIENAGKKLFSIIKSKTHKLEELNF